MQAPQLHDDPQTNRVEMKKYCPTERKRTLHKEVK